MFGGNADNHMVEIQATAISNTIRTYEMSSPQAMQQIRVVGKGTDFMTICEIEVFRQEGKASWTFNSFIAVNFTCRN